VRGKGTAAEQIRKTHANCARRDRYRERDREAERKRAPKKKLLSLMPRGLRDQHGQTRAHAGKRDAGDHLDHGGKLRPQRDEFAAAAQRENLVDGGAPREADSRDRERQKEFGSVDL
jgi:hypothetical protein